MIDSLKPEKERVAKWGFGMAPISTTMRLRYDRAVRSTLEILERDMPMPEIDLDDLSELKGMFNRCVRQDQWDWSSVHAELGLPPAFHARDIAKSLTQLRSATKARDQDLFTASKSELIALNVLLYLHAYQSSPNGTLVGEPEWIYILSRREERDILKIGRTNRPVEQRVKEINGSTGVLRPLSIRRVFPVRDSKIVENAVFKRLSEFRIRLDREFFQIPFDEASKEISDCIKTLKQRWRHSGNVVWFDTPKNYGFIEIDGGENVFVHGSEIPGTIKGLMSPGQSVEFDLGRRRKGFCALNVTLSTY